MGGRNKMKKIYSDKTIALLFLILTSIFLSVFMINQTFFDWVFDRHHNQWSWYIRPIFLIPFCFFAYKRNWTGISITIFCLFTSMFWFSRPEVVSENVKTFLQFERSLAAGLGVVTLMATGKIVWSLQNAGESGKSIIVPAIVGLIICSGLIFIGFKMAERKNEKS